MSSPRSYSPGDGITVDGCLYRVIGVSPTNVCARNEATGQVLFFNQLDLVATGTRADVRHRLNPYDPWVGLVTVPEEERPRVSFLVEHLTEVDTGRHPSRDTPRSEYRLSLPKSRRVRSKAEELSSVMWPDGQRHQISVRTLERYGQQLREAGPAGLLPRAGRLTKPCGNQDRELIRILDAVLADYVDRSDVPTSTLVTRIRLAFEDEHRACQDVCVRT